MPAIKSVLIIGGSGFLGTHLALKLREGYFKVFATYFSRPIKLPGVSFFPCNLENKNFLKKVVYSTQPDVVIYLAGNEDVEWCEKNIKMAELLHSSGPANLANFTEMMQPRFIFVSSPYVFDGSRGNYHENDTVLPGTTLGRMKLGGENVIRNKCLNHIILRSSPVFGRGNGLSLSPLDKIRMALDRNQRIEVSSSELHSLAPVEGLCDTIASLVTSGVRNRILHYGGLTRINHYEFARAFAKRFGYDPSLIIQKKTPLVSQTGQSGAEYDFSMNCTQAIQLLKIKPFLMEEGLDLIQQNLIPRT